MFIQVLIQLSDGVQIIKMGTKQMIQIKNKSKKRYIYIILKYNYRKTVCHASYSLSFDSQKTAFPTRTQSYNVQNNIINTLHAYETCQNPSCDHFIVNFYRLRILRDNWCTLLWLELIM